MDSILYALIARGTTVLAEASEVSGNANLVAHRILEKLPQEDSRVSYSQERHLFHIVVRDGVTFLCMADEELGRRIPFAFLQDVMDRYTSQYGAACHTARAYEHNADFAPVLANRMAYYSSHGGGQAADAINRVRGEISEVKHVMIENIDKVLDRGERIELLVDKTDHLQNESFAFKREARRLKQRLWWKNARLLSLIAFLVLLLAYIIVCFACSPTFRC